ncbi:hypothetical protein CPT_Pepon050 [Stenotrophomonas phage Pepon]|uniref:BIG2 domain-containing protein n=1 Tax=Stenotrophomonas phage Pepon TaxID=2859654 RepID=A0AAE7WMW6_9CAUD|nr:hypothetical protein CPT_Pepon050 [Stenotrophomonas phage Pepon]
MNVVDFHDYTQFYSRSNALRRELSEFTRYFGLHGANLDAAIAAFEADAKAVVDYLKAQKPPVLVTGVTIAPKTASVEVGKTVKLTSTVAPADAANKKVSYASSDATKATVAADGTVTGVAVGSATITVTTEDGAKKDTSVVTVTPPAD